MSTSSGGAGSQTWECASGDGADGDGDAGDDSTWLC